MAQIVMEHTLTEKVIYYFTRKAKQLPDMKLYAILDTARDELI